MMVVDLLISEQLSTRRRLKNDAHRDFTPDFSLAKCSKLAHNCDLIPTVHIVNASYYFVGYRINNAYESE